MLHTIIKENSYQDSIVLMLLTNKLNTVEGIQNVSVMMGTAANKDILKTGGLYTQELEKASPNDMVVVLQTENEDLIQRVMTEMDTFLEEQAQGNNGATQEKTVKTWDKALELGKDASVVVLSIPGVHAAMEIERALDEGKHVFCFSDNVSIEDEKRLKEKAHAAGLLLMGPDCGTGIINGIPVAFTNAVRKGKIGVVGASGTGIQEVTTIIHKLGEGVTNAIGTGGRDLKAEIGGVTLKDSVMTLEKDPNTEVIVVISKPPAPAVRDEVLTLLRSCTKPAVTIFLGEKPVAHEENLYQAYTLEEAAQIAVQLLKQEPVVPVVEKVELPTLHFKPEQKYIKGFYSGGTLAYEAAMLIKDGLGLAEENHAPEGFILQNQGYEIIDLGDDIYTQGKPHPMIDPTKRKEMLAEASQDPTTAIILLDVVLGYGSHKNMAAELAPTLKEIKLEAAEKQREIAIIGTIVGTDQDPQNIVEQAAILKEAGVILCESNAQAVRFALELLDHPVEATAKKVEKATSSKKVTIQPSSDMLALLSATSFINVGLKSFAEVLATYGGTVVQYDWQPTAGGNVTLQRALQFLNKVSLEK